MARKDSTFTGLQNFILLHKLGQANQACIISHLDLLLQKLDVIIGLLKHGHYVHLQYHQPEERERAIPMLSTRNAPAVIFTDVK